jgi:hypothetical protein
LISQLFRNLPKFVYVGDIAGYVTNIVTTISGIVSIIEKALMITNNIVDKHRAYGCFA